MRNMRNKVGPEEKKRHKELCLTVRSIVGRGPRSSVSTTTSQTTRPPCDHPLLAPAPCAPVGVLKSSGFVLLSFSVSPVRTLMTLSILVGLFDLTASFV